MLLRGHYFVMGEPIDMNVDVFRETSVGFLKCVVLQLLAKVLSILIWKVEQNSTGFKK